MSKRFPARRRAKAPRGFIRLTGRVAVPTLAAGFAMWGVAVTADLAFRHAAAAQDLTLSLLATSGLSTRTLQTGSEDLADLDVSAAAKNVRLASLGSEKATSGRLREAVQDPATAPKTARLPLDSKVAAVESLEARFNDVVRQAALSSEKLADIFAEKGLAVAALQASSATRSSGKPSSAPGGAKALLAKTSAPAPARFAAHPQTPYLGTMLAYAEPSSSAESGALAALSDAIVPTPGGLAPYGIGSELPGDAALAPDYQTTPDETPLPLGKPKAKPVEQGQRAREEKPEKPAPARSRTVAAEKPALQPGSNVLRSTRQSEPGNTVMKSERQLAFARPDNPADKSSGGSVLNRMFGVRPSVGRGVAVYDISAAKVYMPDGTVLEAHSGIGHMADNPKYVHVKMNGPTPPHTYNLQMREKRFHGVEAIRMLPVDGRNKHGRDGFLTHSYLLRGGRAESHGCVAFKDYNKFLNAFKQGKVKQLVVVPGGGRSVMTAKNGRDA